VDVFLDLCFQWYLLGNLVLFANIEPQKIDLLQTAIQILSSLLPEYTETSGPAACVLECLPGNELWHSENCENGVTLPGTRIVAVESRSPLHFSGTHGNSRSSVSSAALHALQEYDSCDQDNDMVEQEENVGKECNDSIDISSYFTSEVKR
jgi:hypothetical protein